MDLDSFFTVEFQHGQKDTEIVYICKTRDRAEERAAELRQKLDPEAAIAHMLKQADGWRISHDNPLHGTQWQSPKGYSVWVYKRRFD